MTTRKKRLMKRKVKIFTIIAGGLLCAAMADFISIILNIRNGWNDPGTISKAIILVVLFFLAGIMMAPLMKQMEVEHGARLQKAENTTSRTQR